MKRWWLLMYDEQKGKECISINKNVEQSLNSKNVWIFFSYGNFLKPHRICKNFLAFLWFHKYSMAYFWEINEFSIAHNNYVSLSMCSEVFLLTYQRKPFVLCSQFVYRKTLEKELFLLKSKNIVKMQLVYC